MDHWEIRSSSTSVYLALIKQFVNQVTVTLAFDEVYRTL